MTGRLEGKTAVITGGSRGIGRGIVDRFVAEGAEVLTCGRGTRPDGLDENVLWQQVDISDGDAVAALSKYVKDHWGRLDILVNNAGVQVEKTVVESSDADWDCVMGTNARGVFLACRGLLPLMGAGGSIINIGSISGNQADPSMALYNASKAFVHGLTRSIAVDHGHEGIRCNAICPGWVMTGMIDAAFALSKDVDTAKADALKRHAVGRFGAPSDIAGAAVYLASDDGAFVSGQTLIVDGGLTSASPLQPGLF